MAGDPAAAAHYLSYWKKMIVGSTDHSLDGTSHLVSRQGGQHPEQRNVHPPGTLWVPVRTHSGQPQGRPDSGQQQDNPHESCNSPVFMVLQKSKSLEPNQ